MKLYFLSPYIESSGTESIHQYCDLANILGYDSYLCYHGMCKLQSTLYLDRYLHVKTCVSIEDGEMNIVFTPEVFDVNDLKFTKAKIVIMWLSFDYGVQHIINHLNHHPSRVSHCFQSAYARERVLEVAKQEDIDITWFNLRDYIHDYYLLRSWNAYTKRNIVACKDEATKAICKQNGIAFSEIVNDMKRDEVIETLQRCKVYIDLGSHPGCERLAREAACAGCVVITNKTGSAAYWEDIPISQKTTCQNVLVSYIIEAFEHYDDIIKSQMTYREGLWKAKRIVAKQLKNLIDYIIP